MVNDISPRYKPKDQKSIIDKLTNKILNWDQVYSMIKSYEDIFKQDLIQHCNDNNINIEDFDTFLQTDIISKSSELFKYAFTRLYTFDCPLNFKILKSICINGFHYKWILCTQENVQSTKKKSTKSLGRRSE